MTKEKKTPSNELKELIKELKTRSIKEGNTLWKRIANDLEKSNKNWRKVNINKINRYANPKEVVVVPGKILGNGDLTKEVIVYAWKFTKQAKEKIEKNKGKALSLKELLASKHKPSEVKLIG